jgi:GrpB-like predicted nucleotidyltransferase (UPF0157 family)
MRLGLKRDEIKLVTYSNEWHEEFKRVKQKIQDHTNIEIGRIEHIGSTAIKDMVAKPILDIVMAVDDVNNIDHFIIDGLNKIGFLRLRVDRPAEIIFAKFSDETYLEKTHYLHIVEYDKDLWNNLIFFRDYLNSNATVREEYKNLKKDYIQKNCSGIAEYTDHKEQFVKDIYNKRENYEK